MSTEPQLSEWKAGAGYRIVSVLMGIVGFCFCAVYMTASVPTPGFFAAGFSLIGTAVVMWWMGTIVRLLSEIRDRPQPPPQIPSWPVCEAEKAAPAEGGVYRL